MEEIAKHRQSLTQNRRKVFRVGLAFLFGVSLALLPQVAAAASLYFSPSSGSYTVGGAFSASLYVSSAEQAMNAVSGVISFPQDKLEVVSLSKTGSIFNLWVQEPLFSNSVGTVNFEGIVLNPGFIGSAGKIITLNFRAKREGSALLNFSSGSVLANDGRGTNILASLGSANYFLQVTAIAPPGEEPTAPTLPTQAPAAPAVSSATHPDENKWYSNNSPEFSWELPSGVTAVSYLIDQNPSTNPKFIAETLIEEVSFPDTQDGTWYFHINFKNQYGWGNLTHRKVLIDTEPPEDFNIVVDGPVFLFETTDWPSGIEYYEVKIGEEKTTTTPQDIKDKPYQPLPLSPGKYKVTVTAYDKARNSFSATTDFEILPIGEIKITKIPKNIRIGDILRIEGETLPEIMVRIYIQKEGAEPILEKTTSDLTGNFVLQYDKSLPQGDYLVWAQAEDERGALTNPTERYPLKIGLPPFLQFGKIALDYLTAMITLIVLIIGIIIVVFYAWYRISIWKKRVGRETREASQSVSSAFRVLRDEVEKQISMFDKRPDLTEEEKAVRDKLQDALDVSEEFIGKELKDVEKELE